MSKVDTSRTGNLAKKLSQCGAWKLRRGMHTLTWMPGSPEHLKCKSRISARWVTRHGKPGEVPDLDDPATVGCLWSMLVETAHTPQWFFGSVLIPVWYGYEPRDGDPEIDEVDGYRFFSIGKDPTKKGESIAKALIWLWSMHPGQGLTAVVACSDELPTV